MRTSRLSPRVRPATACAAMLLSGAPLLACPVCFGASDSPMAAGMNAGVTVLLGVTLLVLSALGLGVRRIAASQRRAARMPGPADGSATNARSGA